MVIVIVHVTHNVFFKRYNVNRLSSFTAIGIDHVSLTGAWTSGNDRNLEGLWEWANPITHVYGTIGEQAFSNWFQGQAPSGILIIILPVFALTYFDRLSLNVGFKRLHMINL